MSALGIFRIFGFKHIFWPVTGDYVGVSHHFAFLRHGSKLAIVFIASMKSIFGDASFELIKNLTTVQNLTTLNLATLD